MISKGTVTSKLITKKTSEVGEPAESVDSDKNQASVTIRAFMGMEYECPMGHRFICSGPDRLVKVSSNGTVKVIKNSFIFLKLNQNFKHFSSFRMTLTSF